MKILTVLVRARCFVFFRMILFFTIIMLFFNNSKSQVLSQIVREHLWEYEDLFQYEQYGFFDFDIIYVEMKNHNIISNIDSFFNQSQGLITCQFHTLIPNNYSHLLIIDDTRFLIVNMRESLDNVVSKVSIFLCDSNIIQAEAEFWSQVIGLHYANRTVDVFDRPPNWSYDPLKNSLER